MGAQVQSWLRWIGAAAFLILFYLYVTGFCFPQMRYITEAEMIESALRYRAPQIAELAGDASPEAIAAYLRDNPRCCKIDPSSPMGSSFFQKLTAFYFTGVRIIHRRTADDIARHEPSETYYEAHIRIDRCGHAVKSTGTTIPEGAVGRI
jgi:hypothetical protein